MVQKYMRLFRVMDAMVTSGINDLDPVVRSIGRKLQKLYGSATRVEQLEIDAYKIINF